MKTNSINIVQKNLFVFVPFCLLSPIFQANAQNKPSSKWNQDFLDFFSQASVNVIQMPCPEASFPGYAKGLNRMPHGISYYKNLEGFDKYCEELSDYVANTIFQLLMLENSEIAILGIEHSPTCAASYMYTNKGTQRMQGIFLAHILSKIGVLSDKVHVIGINRRYPHKAYKMLLSLLHT